MGFSAKLLLSAVSVAATAHASGCSAPTTTLQNGGDASALALCSTFTGNIVVETGAVVDNKLSLDGIQKIDGDLTYQDDNVVETFSADTLESITGVLTLNNLTLLSTIDLGSLTHTGNMFFVGLGSLNALGFGTPGLEQVGNVTIENTKIQNLEGIQNATKIDGFYITDNTLLSEISFNVSTIGTAVVGPNDVGSDTGVQFSMPNLESADLFVIQNCSSVSIPSLQSVSDNFELIGNTFENFTAPKLAWSGGLFVEDNTALNNMSFPALQSINGTNSTLTVANNTKLMAIGGFSALKNVNGGVTLEGNFSTAKFPTISRIGGALTVDTASPDFDCSQLPSTGSQIVLGKSSCTKGDTTKIGGSSTGSTSASSSSSVAYAHEIPSSFMPVFGLIAGLLFV